MSEIPIFGTLDMVPHRVGKLWFTGHHYYGSSDEGTRFGYRPIHVGPNPDPEQAELRDYVLEHASDPADGFKEIFAHSYLYTNGPGPLSTDVTSEDVQLLFIGAIDDIASAGSDRPYTDIQVLAGDVLSLLPGTNEPTWNWLAFKFAMIDKDSGAKKRYVSHLALRVDGDHVNRVRFSYPERLKPEVGYRTLLRFLYEWHTSIRRVEAGEFPITPFEVAEEEDWGAFVAELDQAPVPPELFPS